MQLLITNLGQKLVGLFARAAWDSIYLFFWSWLFIVGIADRLSSVSTAVRAPVGSRDKVILAEFASSKKLSDPMATK